MRQGVRDVARCDGDVRNAEGEGMSDHLLRLARVVSRMADHVHTDDIAGMARHLVRDLEAVEVDPTPTERRTITREEFEKALEWLAWNNDPERDAREIAAVWRLTVEDA